MTTLKERIQQVLDEQRVESQRAWARAAGLKSETHVRALLQRDSTDEHRVELRHLEVLARAAGVSPIWLAFGHGGPDDKPMTADMPAGSFLLAIRDRPGLYAAVEKDPGRWRLSTIVRALGMTLQSDSEGKPVGGWAKALDAIQADAGDVRTGDAKSVSRATAKQVGRRPAIPRG